MPARGEMIELIKFAAPDPERADKEALLRELSEEELRALYDRTRAAAQTARAAKDMANPFS